MWYYSRKCISHNKCSYQYCKGHSELESEYILIEQWQLASQFLNAIRPTTLYVCM